MNECEMNLNEYIQQLPEIHLARRQLVALVKAAKSASAYADDETDKAVWDAIENAGLLKLAKGGEACKKDVPSITTHSEAPGTVQTPSEPLEHFEKRLLHSMGIPEEGQNSHFLCPGCHEQKLQRIQQLEEEIGPYLREFFKQQIASEDIQKLIDLFKESQEEHPRT
jgi:hypothetical protein